MEIEQPSPSQVTDSTVSPRRPTRSRISSPQVGLYSWSAPAALSCPTGSVTASCPGRSRISAARPSPMRRLEWSRITSWYI